MAVESAQLPIQTIASNDGGSTALIFDVTGWSVCSLQAVGGAGTWTATLYRSNDKGVTPIALSPAKTVTNALTFSDAIDCTGFRYLVLKITSAGSAGTITCWVSVKG